MPRTREVLTIGTFDVPHLGHAFLFGRAAELGNLTVGVNTDEFVAAYKGAVPITPWLERAKVIEALGYSVVPNPSAGRELIASRFLDYLVIGSDWATRDYYAQIDVDQEFLDKHRITMVYVPRLPNLSSTMMKETHL